MQITIRYVIGLWSVLLQHIQWWSQTYTPLSSHFMHTAKHSEQRAQVSGCCLLSYVPAFIHLANFLYGSRIFLLILLEINTNSQHDLSKEVTVIFIYLNMCCSALQTTHQFTTYHYGSSWSNWVNTCNSFWLWILWQSVSLKGNACHLTNIRDKRIHNCFGHRIWSED